MTIPRLTCTETRPLGYRKAPAAVDSLRRIEYLVVKEADVIQGVQYYVIELYFERSTSRLPTSFRQKPSHLTRSDPHPAEETSRQPDHRVLRRYSDFEEIRWRLWSSVNNEKRDRCLHCKAWKSFLWTSLLQPRHMMKFVPNRKLRSQLLTSFMTAVVALTLQTAEAARHLLFHCEISDTVPPLVQRFVGQNGAWPQLGHQHIPAPLYQQYLDSYVPLNQDASQRAFSYA